MKRAVLKPVSKQSAEMQTTENLRNYILSGTVKPGSRLTEVSLADQLGVARTTLRTSLNRLTSEGIVVLIPYTGWQVASLTEGDVWELWTLRGSLEGLAAKLAAESMTSTLRAKIKRAIDGLVNACTKGDVHKASEADFALHRTIIGSVGHARLESQYRQVEQQVRFYIATSNALVGNDLTSIIGQHEALIDALMAADPARAAHEAWAHNQSEGNKLVAWIRDQDRAAAS